MGACVRVGQTVVPEITGYCPLSRSIPLFLRSIGSLLLHHIFLRSPCLLPLPLSSLLSAACCTVWVSLWGLRTVCMCLGWQTGLTHLPSAFLSPPPPSHHLSLPVADSPYICMHLCHSAVFGMYVCSTRPSISFSPCLCFSLKNDGEGGLFASERVFYRMADTCTNNPC